MYSSSEIVFSVTALSATRPYKWPSQLGYRELAVIAGNCSDTESNNITPPPICRNITGATTRSTIG